MGQETSSEPAPEVKPKPRPSRIGLRAAPQERLDQPDLDEYLAEDSDDSGGGDDGDDEDDVGDDSDSGSSSGSDSDSSSSSDDDSDDEVVIDEDELENALGKLPRNSVLANRIAPKQNALTNAIARAKDAKKKDSVLLTRRQLARSYSFVGDDQGRPDTQNGLRGHVVLVSPVEDPSTSKTPIAQSSPTPVRRRSSLPPSVPTRDDLDEDTRDSPAPEVKERTAMKQYLGLSLADGPPHLNNPSRSLVADLEAYLTVDGSAVSSGVSPSGHSAPSSVQRTTRRFHRSPHTESDRSTGRSQYSKFLTMTPQYNFTDASSMDEYEEKRDTLGDIVNSDDDWMAATPAPSKTFAFPNWMNHLLPWRFRGRADANGVQQQPRRRRRRSNSTSTMHLEHTIYCPNDRVSTESVAVAIVALIQESKKRPAFILRYFEPDVQQMLKLSTYNPRAFLDEPSVYEVFQFMHKLFKKAQLSPECNIISLAYVERLIAKTQVTISASNWRHILFGAMVLASKVWDDLSMINVDFSVVCPMFTIHQINDMEIKWLEFLDWEVTIFGTEYARYYFQLREFHEAHYGKQRYVRDIDPVDMRVARALSIDTMTHNRHELDITLSAPPLDRAETVDDIEAIQLGRRRAIALLPV